MWSRISSSQKEVVLNKQEQKINDYVIHCFFVVLVVFFIVFLLNVLDIFVVEQTLVTLGFFSTLLLYSLSFLASRTFLKESKWLKYFILFCVITFVTVAGVFLTYHTVLISILPFLYATAYSSKPVMRYVYILSIISTIIIVYGGYYFGLCDANMTLLTTGPLYEYNLNGKFALDTINENPTVTLFLYFVAPRCMIYIAFDSICSRIYNILSDSLEKARLNEELEIAKINAENANRAKTQFLARMSHEIRTPINSIMGMNEMILRESNEEEIREYAQDAKDSSMHLLDIVNEILDSSKIESGKMEIVESDYKIKGLLNDLYNIIKIRANEKNLKLVFDIDPNIPSEYYGDEKRIKQVILNLLTNAVKYTMTGTVTLRVTCVADGDDGILTCSVIDTGIGIKEEDISRIYDEFQRFDIVKNRNIEGTGLGMKIVQQLLKLMGSELRVKSEYEKGSEFSFDIMQKIVNHEPVNDFRERPNKVKKDTKIFTAPGARILIVDDNYVNLKVFKGLLKRTQADISEAGGGLQCLDMLKTNEYDLIFLDHMMPDLDGIETLKAIREYKLTDAPIVMLTANDVIGDREKYIAEGFDDFISKPIITEKLEEILLRHLSGKVE